MKKYFALLMIAATILSAGCGNKVAEVKQEAAEEVHEAVTDVKKTADKVDRKVAEVAGTTPTTGTAPAANIDQQVLLGGVAPGMTLDQVKQVLGEPTSVHDGDEFTFSNGVMVDLDDFGKVEEVKTYQAGVKTAGGISVGMTEQNLTAAYGAPAVTENDDGMIEYKYFSRDGSVKVKFYISNGTIVEIKSSLRD